MCTHTAGVISPQPGFPTVKPVYALNEIHPFCIHANSGWICVIRKLNLRRTLFLVLVLRNIWKARIFAWESTTSWKTSSMPTFLWLLCREEPGYFRNVFYRHECCILELDRCFGNVQSLRPARFSLEAFL